MTIITKREIRQLKRACTFIGLWVQLFQAQAHLKRFHHKDKCKYKWLNFIQLTRGVFRPS